jgi:hypothetical protein
MSAGRWHRRLSTELQRVSATGGLLNNWLGAELQGMAIGHLLNNGLRAEGELSDGLAMHL